MVCRGFYDSPIGKLVICSENGFIVSIGSSAPAEATCRPSSLTDLAARQLSEYFEGTRKGFDFPIRFTGTDFQKSVWKQLMLIPYGQTRTYGDIAAAIGNPGLPGLWVWPATEIPCGSRSPATGFWDRTGILPATQEALTRNSFFWNWNGNMHKITPEAFASGVGFYL